MAMKSSAAATSKAAMLKPFADAASQVRTWPFFKVSASSLTNVWFLWMILTPTPVSASNSTTANKTSCFSATNDPTCRLLQVFSIVSLGLVWFLAFGLCFWRFLQFRAEQQLQKQEDQYQRRRIYKKPSMEKMTLILIACLISQCSAQPEVSVKATQYKWLCVAEIECKDKELTYFQWHDDIINKTSLSLQLDARLAKQSLICTNNFTKLSTEVDLRDYCKFPLTASYVVKKTLPFYMTFLASLFIIARFPELRTPAILSCLPITFAQDEASIQTPATNYMLVYVIIFMMLKVKKTFYLWLFIVCVCGDIHISKFEHEYAQLDFSAVNWSEASWYRLYTDKIISFGTTLGNVDKNRVVVSSANSNIKIFPNISLIIENLNTTNNGTYLLKIDQKTYHYNLEVISSPFINTFIKDKITVYATQGSNVDLNCSIKTFREATWDKVSDSGTTRFGIINPDKIEKEFPLKPDNCKLNCNLSLIIANASFQDNGNYTLTVTHPNNSYSKFYYTLIVSKPVENFHLNVSRVKINEHWCQVTATCAPPDDRPYLSYFKWEDHIEKTNYKVVMLNTSAKFKQPLCCYVYTPSYNYYDEIDISEACIGREKLLHKGENWLPVLIVAPICFLIIGIIIICTFCKFNTKYTLYALLIHKGADAAAVNATHYDSNYQNFITILAVLSGISFFVGSVHLILWCLFRFYKK